eukprot:scaffold7207_cov62-Phaeocystis_antarctica.AAC.11
MQLARHTPAVQEQRELLHPTRRHDVGPPARVAERRDCRGRMLLDGLLHGALQHTHARSDRLPLCRHRLAALNAPRQVVHRVHRLRLRLAAAAQQPHQRRDPPRLHHRHLAARPLSLAGSCAAHSHARAAATATAAAAAAAAADSHHHDGGRGARLDECGQGARSLRQLAEDRRGRRRPGAGRALLRGRAHEHRHRVGVEQRGLPLGLARHQLQEREALLDARVAELLCGRVLCGRMIALRARRGGAVALAPQQLHQARHAPEGGGAAGGARGGEPLQGRARGEHHSHVAAHVGVGEAAQQQRHRAAREQRFCGEVGRQREQRRRRVRRACDAADVGSGVRPTGVAWRGVVWRGVAERGGAGRGATWRGVAGAPLPPDCAKVTSGPSSSSTMPSSRWAEGSPPTNLRSASAAAASAGALGAGGGGSAPGECCRNRACSAFRASSPLRRPEAEASSPSRATATSRGRMKLARRAVPPCETTSRLLAACRAASAQTAVAAASCSCSE